MAGESFSHTGESPVFGGDYMTMGPISSAGDHYQEAGKRQQGLGCDHPDPKAEDGQEHPRCRVCTALDGEPWFLGSQASVGCGAKRRCFRAKDLAPSPVTSFLCGPGPVSPLTEGLGLAFYNVQVLDGTVKGPSCAEWPDLSDAKVMAPGKAAQRPWLGEGPWELGQGLPIVVPNPCIQLTPCSLLKIPNPDSTQDSLHLNLWDGLPGKLPFANPTPTWLGDSAVHRSLSV